MHVPSTYLPLYSYQNFFRKNNEPKYSLNPFGNMEILSNIPQNNTYHCSAFNTDINYDNNSCINGNKNNSLNVPYIMERPKTNNACYYNTNYFPMTNGSNNNNMENVANVVNYKLFLEDSVKKESCMSTFTSTTSKSLNDISYINNEKKNKQKKEKKYNIPCNIYVERCRRVLIFDLDDTLIPTCWIRSYLYSKYIGNCEKKTLCELKRDIKLNKNCNIESTLCALMHLAISLCHTVCIVTNARSDKWINTVKWLFPSFSKFIDKLHIPIIRTDQRNDPSSIKVFEYFRFWMDAKKKKFDQIVKQHCSIYNEYITNNINFISVGDTRFEEVATYELQLNNRDLIKKAFNIRVQSGLCLEGFVAQLKLIQVALSIITKGSYDFRYLALSSSVLIGYMKHIEKPFSTYHHCLFFYDVHINSHKK
ncbi:hypothetical protein PFMG_02236 [Plasmodium falciparum IGH-CR14]|uniref:Uncharacterized protein n=1 Tax=Plasmodium falciparum IGH-CR14 TaxID=580059 RepID=A0A0L1I970_PLAFA|nr:hypothetical protein PFMG_02236 [Plasmodium falciparum IGH-CR14]